MKKNRRDVDWNDYRPFDPGVTGPWHELSREDAERVYERVMQTRYERIGALRELLRRNGVELRESNEGIRQLEEWLRRSAEADPADPGRPDPIWLAVAYDVGVFLGEVMHQRRGDLRWEFFRWGMRDISYQRPVIMGFDVPNKRYNIDPILLASSVAFQAIQGDRNSSDLVDVLERAGAREMESS